MDYFNDVIATFLGLERVSSIVVYAESENWDFVKNILICVPKMNSLTGSERHGWVLNDRIFVFGWTIPLKIEYSEPYTFLVF